MAVVELSVLFTVDLSTSAEEKLKEQYKNERVGFVKYFNPKDKEHNWIIPELVRSGYMGSSMLLKVLPETVEEQRNDDEGYSG